MGESKEDDAEDCFFDAFDEFPFHDCSDPDIAESTSYSTISHVGVDDPAPQLVHRRIGASFDAPGTSATDLVQEESINVAEEINLNMAAQSNWLMKSAGSIFRSIWFSMRLIFNISSSPLRTLYHIYMFVTDPFSIKKRIQDYVIRKALRLWYPVTRTVLRHVYELLKEQKIIWKLAQQLGWGVLWGLYVFLVMCALLVFAVMVSGKVVKHVAAPPVFIKESLSLDYSCESPVSYFRASGCCSGQCESDGLLLIPRNHKVEVGVSLTMPESDYNRNLGMFQVQVEAMSKNGKAGAAMSQPCTLQYRSMPIKLILTLLEMVPLVTGYRSESQTRHINMGTYIEGALPTTCFKVILKGRAEFPSGAGVPEIYSAFITIKSKHFLLTRLVWYLKPLLFLWICFLFFMTELLFVLLFCPSILLLRFASGDRSGNSLGAIDDHTTPLPPDPAM